MKITDVWDLREAIETAPQWRIEANERCKKKKAKARRKRKLTKTTSTKNNRKHKLNGYRGRRVVHSCRSWR